MKIRCYMADTARDRRVGEALVAGFKRHGCDADFVRRDDGLQAADLAVFVGVRHSSARLRDAAVAANQPYMMLDKGYFDRSRYHRFSVGSPQPLYLNKMDYSANRFNKLFSAHAHTWLGKRGGAIIYVESTQKYYDFYGINDVRAYSAGILGQLKSAARGRWPIWYRPRYRGADTLEAPMGFTTAPLGSMCALFPHAHCVVSHGSNAGVEALLAGVPVVSIGDQSCNPVHDLSVPGIDALDLPVLAQPRAAVMQRCYQLAWCQFSLAEIGRGLAWDVKRRWVK